MPLSLSTHRFVVSRPHARCSPHRYRGSRPVSTPRLLTPDLPVPESRLEPSQGSGSCDTSSAPATLTTSHDFGFLFLVDKTEAAPVMPRLRTQFRILSFSITAHDLSTGAWTCDYLPYQLGEEEMGRKGSRPSWEAAVRNPRGSQGNGSLPVRLLQPSPLLIPVSVAGVRTGVVPDPDPGRSTARRFRLRLLHRTSKYRIKIPARICEGDSDWKSCEAALDEEGMGQEEVKNICHVASGNRSCVGG
ncbi:hypothetical protein DFH94DRAFT_152285 [Russula ochroleuca]|uniref:Uncharacterized protein n=1 Tax=Russula ochroleuca TaxID=152965 RepID=A0A9P5N436_9AGAM|nr:hypothetical protein DFH94DRAFT_152285 [Russula ochroleuca]